MIVVDVRLDSARGADHDAHLFTMVIANDGTGDERTGNYRVYLGRRNKRQGRDPHYVLHSPLRKGTVKGHPRKSTHVGVLLRRALESVNL